MNKYKATAELPYHLAVGAVVINESNEVCVHHYKDIDDAPSGTYYEDVYTLMRETMENNESLEEAVLRGVGEGFGLTGEILKYIGPLTAIAPGLSGGVRDFEKTTLYFLVRKTGEDASLLVDEGFESLGTIEWKPIDFLIEHMEKEAEKHTRTDLNESAVLRRVIALTL